MNWVNYEGGIGVISNIGEVMGNSYGEKIG